jgi:aminoglycoside 6'-N-acetyltransferase I
MPVRSMRPDERDAVHEMMRALWPDFDGEDAAGEQVMVFERPASEGGTLGGFVSFSIRARAEGCATSPVPYIEGWWVAPELRQRGVGRDLIAAVERWARMCGFTELGSDADSVNALGVAAHKSLGFEETARMVFFRKKLGSR